ncbi:MAG: LysR family transcriptional regulator [Marmoricola sp.]
MQLDPRRLAVLLNIHRSGGVLAAADTVRVTPSAISQQIARLEEETGITVLDRQPGGAVLTPAGRILVDAAERIESELTDARRALVALQGDVTGTVVIGAFQSVIQALLVPLVDDLRERLPGLDLIVQEVAAEDGQRGLREGAVDLLLLEADSPIGRSHPRGTHDVAVLEEPWVVAVPAHAPAPATIDELAQVTWLGVDPSAAAHRATERLHATFARAPHVAHVYSDSDVAISMVAGGLGVALLPSLALLGALRREGIQAVSMAGLGNRLVVARHRSTRAEPRREVLTVLNELVQAAADLDLTAV